MNFLTDYNTLFDIFYSSNLPEPSIEKFKKDFYAEFFFQKFHEKYF